MIPVGMLHDEQFFFTVGIRLIRVVFGDLESRHDGRMGCLLCGVKDEEFSVGFVFRMEGHPQEAFFVLFVDVNHFLGHIEKDRGLFRVLVENVDDPLLLRHKNPVGTVAGVCQQDWSQGSSLTVIPFGVPARPFQVGKSDDRFQFQRRFIDLST